MAKVKETHCCFDCLKAKLIQWYKDPIIAECRITGERDVAKTPKECDAFKQGSRNPEIEHRKKRLGITDKFI